MINEANIQKIVDYTLLNACSINSSGLYNGKVGIALALFETARFLQDEYIEEQAFDLLQEALISKTDDISFENGLCGIGYVLIYLIKNDFIDTDFDELFCKQYEKILTDFEKLKGNPSAILNAIRINYFMTAVKPYRRTDKRVDEVIKSILEANELYLAIQFFDFKDGINYIYNKNTLLERFEIYLQTVYECCYADYSRVVLDDYAELYRSGRIISSYKVAHYMEILDAEGKYKDVIANNRQYSDFKKPKNLTLRNRIDLAKLSGENNCLRNIISNNETKELEKVILQLIPHGAFVPGYEQGISRLLIYMTSKTPKIL